MITNKFIINTLIGTMLFIMFIFAYVENVTLTTTLNLTVVVFLAQMLWLAYVILDLKKERNL